MAYQVFRPISNVRGILFDMDGVILDSEGLYTRFWREAAIATGYPMTREQAAGMRALNRESAAAQLERYFGPGVDYPQVLKKRIERMDAYVGSNGIPAKPGIGALLDALKDAHIPTAICTGSPLDRVKRYLSPLGLLDRFDAVITSYDVEKSKPAPDIYLKGAATLGLPSECCIALEDSSPGLLSASRAGCMAVMIPDQDKPSAEDLRRAHALFDSLSDVIGLLSLSSR